MRVLGVHARYKKQKKKRFHDTHLRDWGREKVVLSNIIYIFIAPLPIKILKSIVAPPFCTQAARSPMWLVRRLWLCIKL